MHEQLIGHQSSSDRRRPLWLWGLFLAAGIVAALSDAAPARAAHRGVPGPSFFHRPAMMMHPRPLFMHPFQPSHPFHLMMHARQLGVPSMHFFPGMHHPATMNANVTRTFQSSSTNSLSSPNLHVNRSSNVTRTFQATSTNTPASPNVSRTSNVTQTFQSSSTNSLSSPNRNVSRSSNVTQTVRANVSSTVTPHLHHANRANQINRRRDADRDNDALERRRDRRPFAHGERAGLRAAEQRGLLLGGAALGLFGTPFPFAALTSASVGLPSASGAYGGGSYGGMPYASGGYGGGSYGGMPYGYGGGSDGGNPYSPSYPISTGASSYYPSVAAAPAQPTTAAQPAPSGEALASPQLSAQVEVIVPDPNAQVWFDGRPTKSTGKQRVFYSPPLQPGTSYVYTVRATWGRGGENERAQVEVNLTPGATSRVDFTQGRGGEQGKKAGEPLP